MNLIVKFFTFLTILTKRIGTCGNVGLIAGSIAGLMLSLLDFGRTGLVLSNEEAFYISLILTGFTWIIILFILCLLVRLTFNSVALPSFFNCLLTCLATVFVTKWLNAYPFAWLIGMLIGILIGLLLCRLNNLVQKTPNAEQ